MGADSWDDWSAGLRHGDLPGAIRHGDRRRTKSFLEVDFVFVS
jgi:hypothetical protein